jgi:hypothetical protein
MASPGTETIFIRLTGREYAFIQGLAEARGASASDIVRELLGFGPEEAPDRLSPRLTSGPSSQTQST